MQTELEVVEGSVETVVFHNADTGFTVLEIAHNGELLTVVGEIPTVGEGESIKASGSFATHPTYGRQFKALAVEQVMPATASAILKYLSGGAVKGIGPVLAKRIVTQFGDQTLEMFENQPEKLSQIRGISPDKADSIAFEYRKIVGVRALMMFLAAHQIGPAAAIAAWKKWGVHSQSLIMADPFSLCADDIGIPFEKADEVALSLGFGDDAPCRVRGGIVHVLSHNLSNGHSCLPMEKLTLTAARLLGIGSDEVLDQLDWLIEADEVRTDRVDGEDFVYLTFQYLAEVYCADRLNLLLSLPRQADASINKEIANLEETLCIRYAQKQKEAIRLAMESPVMILTGGPGTGITTTLNGIIKLCEKNKLKVALAAPTGRAAKRLSEVSGHEAKTIHRLLEVDYGSDVYSPSFKRDEKNPLPADAVIIDEMSMVDVKLFASLLRALRMNCKLILVGDPDQLPSVGAGNVLRDLIASEMTDCVHLDEVFRQAAESLIIVSAHDVVHGQLPDLSQKSNDFFFLNRSSAEETAATVCDLVARRLPKAYDFSPLFDIQVLSPSRQGTTGTFELNRLMQQALNPPSKQKTEHLHGTLLFREGDKVMQIRNNYDLVWQRSDGEEGLGVFNGDIGFIETIDKPSRSVMVKFEDRLVIYTFDMLNELELSYAVTIHKSQGNEFDAVVIPLVGSHRRLHYRNLLYTGVTRAKKLLILVGSPQTVQTMVENNKKTLRYTLLAQRLRKML